MSATCSHCYNGKFESSLVISNLVAIIQMWPFKSKLIKIKIQFLSCTSHITSGQQAGVESGYCPGQQSQTFPSLHKLLLDSSALEGQITAKQSLQFQGPWLHL